MLYGGMDFKLNDKRYEEFFKGDFVLGCYISGDVLYVFGL